MDHDPLMTGLTMIRRGWQLSVRGAECSAARPNEEKTFANSRYEGEWSRGCLGPANHVRISAGGPECHMRASRSAIGAAVFDKVCAICHGDHLQGGPAPALAGEQFLSVSQFQKVDAGYFYRFMSTHMPLNAPGSLSKGQYLDLLAYLLAANGYSSGSHELTANNEELKGIKIEPQN
jgi:hypothetical protein